MAVNLNPPSNFAKKSSDEQKTVLLPPSSFEAAAPSIDPWQALAKATGEILDLRQQNTKLKSDRHVTFPVGEELKARVDLHQHANPPPVQPALRPEYIELSHYHDIINRQAADLTDLRKQLSVVSASCDKQVAKLESDILLKETDHRHRVSSLEEKLKNCTTLLESERQTFASSKMKWEEDRSVLSGQCRRDLEAKQRLHEEQVLSLESQLTETRECKANVEDELNRKIREYEAMIKEQTNSLAQMKTYLTETEDSTKSKEIWKKDLDNIKNKLEAKESERAKLEAEVDLLNIRLKSQNEMFMIQERELSKVKDTNTEKKKQCLLTRWREKVFELLLQNEMADIVLKDQERQWKNKVYDLEGSVEKWEAEGQMLKCSLQDKQAQLDMQTNTVTALQQELMRAQELAINLDDKNKMDEQSIHNLVHYVNSLSEHVVEMENAQASALSQLSSYNQRITFASGRVEFLQSQFARKEALIRLEMEETLNDRPTTDKEQVTNTPESSPELERELERVTEERDALAAQIKADARLLEKKILMAKQQVSEEVSMLKNRVTELHEALEDKTKVCESLDDQVKDLLAEQEESKETVDVLKTQLAKAQLQAQTDVEEARKAEQMEFTEQLAGMEHKLNDARREHAKAVVSLRQLERQCARDKERHSEQIHTLEAQYTAENNKLQDKWRAAEKDKNLLMATLRQEGILNKVKFNRPAPMISEEVPDYLSQKVTAENSELPTRDTGLYATEGQATTSHRATSRPRHSSTDSDEPLHAVIDDLKSLAQSVLSDEENSDSDQPNISQDIEDI